MTEYISSDTNVWIDFDVIDATDLPFRLPVTYVMWSDAVEDEVCSPTGLKDSLLKAGLVAVKLTTDEFFLASDYGDRYPGLSGYDSVALSIAKCREITLMTGDMRLRKAAVKEGVAVTGTIGVVDRLLAEGLTDENEYRDIVQRLLDANGGVVRLPEDELRKRLDAPVAEIPMEEVGI
jgi:predicted nucleic acid-binding protein